MYESQAAGVPQCVACGAVVCHTVVIADRLEFNYRKAR